MALALTLTVGIGVTLGLAALSWYFFEAPILRLRDARKGHADRVVSSVPTGS